MYPKQKETALSQLEKCQNTENFYPNYLIPYKDFFGADDDFTEFNFERKEGKNDYLNLIEQLINISENIKVFVELQGIEKDKDDIWIYSDTLIIYSELPIDEIKKAFNQSGNIFPSNIGEFTQNEHASKENIIIDENGNLCFSKQFNKFKIYYCWWD